LIPDVENGPHVNITERRFNVLSPFGNVAMSGTVTTITFGDEIAGAKLATGPFLESRPPKTLAMEMVGAPRFPLPK
jgi:hypothetical protein